MQISQVFDELYDGYTAKIRRWVPCYDNMVSQLPLYLPDTFTPTRILDLGCGNGNATQVLRSAFPQAHYLLVDASAEMISGCQERFSKHTDLAYQQAFFQALSLPDQSFQLIVACLSIHHLQAQEKAVLFQKIYQWLKPGGIFLTGDLMIERAEESFHQEHLKEWKKVATAQGTSAEEWTFLMDHYNTYDFPSGVEQQLDWLQAAGFTKTEIAFRKIGWTVVSAQK